MPTPPQKKSELPTWAMILIALGIVGIAVTGMLAPIAIPNFVQALETTQRNTCISNLREMEGAKHSWKLEQKKTDGDPVTAPDISGYLRPGSLICPKGGTYQINPIGKSPTCSIPGHQLPEVHVPPSR